MKKKCIDLAIEQAVTNICLMVCQNTNVKIGLSFFGCEVNILPNVHIVQCHVEAVVSFDKNRFRAFSS